MKTFIVLVTIVISSFTLTAQNTEMSKLQEENNLYYLNGKVYTGKVYAKHDNGSIGLVGEFQNGMKVGTWTYWYSTGEKKRESQYTNNKKEGITYYWYQNGQLAKEIMYRDDKNID